MEDNRQKQLEKSILESVYENRLKSYRCNINPIKGMAGPFVLNHKTVHEVVGNSEYGWYWLGREWCDGVPQVNYVGRSDNDLAGRILKPREHEYLFFWVRVVNTVHEAFNGECEDWHKFGADALDNKIHPDRPDGHKYVCPICGGENMVSLTEVLRRLIAGTDGNK